MNENAPENGYFHSRNAILKKLPDFCPAAFSATI
jgi:hypothetical protein